VQRGICVVRTAPLPRLGTPLLTRQQGHASCDQHRGDPPPLIHAFMQEDFGGEGVADEGERSGGGGDEAYVSQESANSRLKNATAMAATPKTKF